MQIHNMQKFPLFIALIVCLAIAGCSRDGLPGLVPAGGVVTLNGVPVEGATISFSPDPSIDGARSASATTDRNGRFVVTTLNFGDGMMPGEYRVVVSKTTGTGGELSAGEGGGRADTDDRRTVNHLPLIYASMETSGLTVSIPPRGDRNIEFVLEGEVDLTPQAPGWR